MGKEFGDLFSDSMKEFGDKFITFLKAFFFLYFLPVLGLIILMLIIFIPSLLIYYGNSVINPESMEFTLSALNIGFLIFMIFFAVLFCLAFLMISAIYGVSYLHIAFSKKKDILIKDIYYNSKKYFWKYLGLILLMSFLLILLFILFIIPGIIFLVYWIFAVYILINENCGIGESLRRSKELVKGRWWTVFGYGFLIAIISSIASIILGFVPFVGFIASSVIVSPFVVIFFKNFYLELKKSRIKK
jgi:hypothetical protein